MADFDPTRAGPGGAGGPTSGAPTAAAPTTDAGPRDDRSLGDLIRELGSESSRLVREEVALAKAEMSEKVDVYERNLIRMLVGGVLLLGAAAVLLVAMNRGLTALFAQFMPLEVAVWLAPLILAGITAAIGWSLVKAAQRAMKEEGVAPRRTVETLREETEWVRQEAKEVTRG